MGVSPGLPTTNHGETRIRNCAKYDLGDGYRLITVEQGEFCFAVFLGDHDSCDHWLDRNRGLTLHKDPISGRTDFAQLPGEATAEDLRGGPATLDERPYLMRLGDVSWDRVFPNRFMRDVVLELNEHQDDDRIWSTVAQVQQESQPLGDLLVGLLNHTRSGELERARLLVRAHLGEVERESPERPIEEVVLAEELRSAINGEHFIVLNDLSAEDLEARLDPLKFQEWMLFLHPDQRRVVEEDFDKPAVLTGVSGSGKTCVLVHRARRLAEKYPNERILILTLNKSLARLIEHLVGALCLKGEQHRIDVMAFHEYLSAVLKALRLDDFLKVLAEFTKHEDAIGRLRARTAPARLQELFQAHEETKLFSRFREFLESSEHQAGTEAFRLQTFVEVQSAGVDAAHYLYEELELVRSAFPGYEDYQQYLTGYERPGRSIAFQEERRAMVLKLLHAWEDYQLGLGFLDHMGLTQAATLAIDIDGDGRTLDLFRYRCVLVDEFQDFSTLDIKLLQRIPRDRVNGLFFTGDLAQKIYAKELSFPRAGLGVGSRTCRAIRKNYRNTRQILQAADALLREFSPPADGDPDLCVLSPELAARDSALPIAIEAADPLAEAWRQTQEWLSEGNPGVSVCIASANADTLSSQQILQACPSGIRAEELTGNYLLNPETVVVSDITTIKGFEFSLIIILGLEEGTFPAQGRCNDEQWRDAIRLYVAITRGRDEVRFPYADTPSRFLQAMGEHIEWRKASPAPVVTEIPVLPPSVVPTVDSYDGVRKVTIESPASQKEGEFRPGTESADKAHPVAKPNEVPLPDKGATLIRTEDSPRDTDLKSVLAVSAPLPCLEATAFPPQPRRKKANITFLNGQPVATIPRNWNQHEIAEFLGQTQTDVSILMQSLGMFLVPTQPLPDHFVRRVLEHFGLGVAFV